MMSNLWPGTETVSLLVSSYNEEQHAYILAHARVARFPDPRLIKPQMHQCKT